ncbi:hypothetical protein [uncultured Microbacterium sp.]|nr:hypothetical protein [uncultured Microbacterium sp.]
MPSAVALIRATALSDAAEYAYAAGPVPAPVTAARPRAKRQPAPYG